MKINKGSADENEVSIASIENSTEIDPLVTKIDKKLGSLLSQMQRLTKMGKKGIYEGQGDSRGVPLSASRRSGAAYNQAVLFTKRGEKLPHSFILLINVPRPEYMTDKDDFQTAVFLERSNRDDSYYFEILNMAGDGPGFRQAVFIGRKPLKDKEYKSIDSLLTKALGEGKLIVDLVEDPLIA